MHLWLMMLGKQIHIAGPLVPEPNFIEVEIAFEKFKRYYIMS